MRSLESHHITDLYVLIDDLLPLESNIGRPGISTREVVTLLLFNTLTDFQPLLKNVHTWAKRHYSAEFPSLPEYSAFVDQVHQAYPYFVFALKSLLVTNAPVRWVDSTGIAVCKNQRVERYKVARDETGWGKNWQGSWYGFKLHGAINQWGQFCAVTLTSASQYDGHELKRLTNRTTKVAVGDTHYGGRAQTKPLNSRNGTIFLAYPHPKQNKKVLAHWQKILLSFRSKIESVWDYLKEHLKLVTSFPRSLTGYTVHYLRILIAYQLSVL